MKRVLIINTNKYDYTGIVSFIRTYCYPIKNSDIKIEYVGYEIHTKFLEEFKCLNLMVHTVSSKKLSPIKYYYELNKILKNYYDVVHIHGSSALIAFELLLAKCKGIKKRIAHIHNTACTHPRLNTVLSPLFKACSTHRIACSKEAGEWGFGKKEFSVIKNAIDLDKFYFDPMKREQIRKELNIKETDIVLGHVGHFNDQKNHVFLINIFISYHKQYPHSKLLLVGGGVLEESIRHKVREEQLDDSVLFLGKRDDIDALMCAMDCLVFPSKWEGLGIVLIEGQATGLPCCVATTIPCEAQVSEWYISLELEEDSSIWCKNIQVLVESTNNRMNRSIKNSERIKIQGYSITLEKEKLVNFYLR